MESSSWPGSLPCNRIKAIQELTRGQQLTNKLREMLIGQQEKIESDLKLVDGVVAEILNSYTFNEKLPHIQTHDMRYQKQSHDSGESDKSVRGCLVGLNSWD
ncbi:hypothetical protein Tco_0619790 [Tanacetum coccineum]